MFLRVRQWTGAFVLLAMVGGTAGRAGLRGQGTGPAKSEAELDKEARQADELYKQGQTLATLPLYEELHTLRPGNAAYTERLAAAYIAKGGTAESEQERVEAQNHARHLFKEAHEQGDNSDYWQVMTEKLGPDEVLPVQGVVPATALADDPKAPGGPFARAEILFSKGDLPGAIALYKESWTAHPQFYAAPLFAGDCEYKLGHYDEASIWFARAIAIDPDTETAHRYWADSLAKAGKPNEAKKQYIEAYLANPYQKAPRLALRTWAQGNGYRYIPPAATLPAPPTTGKDGHINITMNMGDKDDPAAPGWLMYSMSAALWQGDKFKKEYPAEKSYRHSLAEEVDAIHGLLEYVRSQKLPDKKLTPTLRTLIALDKDGMLECWILLDNPDEGIAQDYRAYRKTHKDLLRSYIERYDLHPV